MSSEVKLPSTYKKWSLQTYETPIESFEDLRGELCEQQLQRCERLLALGERLSAIIQGEKSPGNAAQEIDDLADLLYHMKSYARAARLYTDAFAADPKLADDLEAENRYNAARYAALAGCGRGIDAIKLDDKERARLRRQALDWLRADLSVYAHLLKYGTHTLVQEQLSTWHQNADLACMRDAKELAKLPADERQVCEKLWADVAALLTKSQQKK